MEMPLLERSHEESDSVSFPTAPNHGIVLGQSSHVDGSGFELKNDGVAVVQGFVMEAPPSYDYSVLTGVTSSEVELGFYPSLPIAIATSVTTSMSEKGLEYALSSGSTGSASSLSKTGGGGGAEKEPPRLQALSSRVHPDYARGGRWFVERSDLAEATRVAWESIFAERRAATGSAVRREDRRSHLDELRAQLSAERIAAKAVREEHRRIRAGSGGAVGSDISTSDAHATASRSSAGGELSRRTPSSSPLYHIHYRVPEGVGPGCLVSISPSGGVVAHDEVVVTVPDGAEPGLLVEVALQDEHTGNHGAAAVDDIFGTRRLEPSEGWGYSGRQSRAEVDAAARERYAKQAAADAELLNTPCEIVDGTYTYGEHKDDTAYAYDPDKGKGNLTRGDSYTYN